MKDARQALLDDTTRVGRAWCAAYTELIDDWLLQLLSRAAGSPAVHGVSLVAVGGYGRGELAPHSDIDVLLLHTGRPDIAHVAERIWYPIWDEGLKLGHAVRTAKEALALADDDLDTATSLLSARHVAGDADLTGDLADRRARERWHKRGKRWLGELARSVEERHAARRRGRLPARARPEGGPGRAARRPRPRLGRRRRKALLFDGDAEPLDASYGTLLDARVELHRRAGRPGDVLLLQEQDAVAAALGRPDADALMHDVATAARTIAWTSDDAWRRITSVLRGPVGRLSRRDRPLAEGVVLRDGEVHVDARRPPRRGSRARPAGRGAGGVDGDDHRPRRRSSVLAAETRAAARPVAARGAHPAVGAAAQPGRPRSRVIEALDQKGLWVRVLPEWAPTRSRPQRNAYHRFTVDRHLVEAAVGAAALAGRVLPARPARHRHAAARHRQGPPRRPHRRRHGARARPSATRMGFPPRDVETLVSLVEHHLLLPDVATRRDLDDPGTIDLVAKADRRQRHPRPARRPDRGATRWRPVRRRGAAGRRASSPSSSSAPPTCSPAAGSRTSAATSSPRRSTSPGWRRASRSSTATTTR